MVGYCVAGAFLSVAHYPYLGYFSTMATALDVAVKRKVYRRRRDDRVE
jgi:hypothetical protein